MAGFAAWVVATQTLAPPGTGGDTGTAVAESEPQLHEPQGAGRRSENAPPRAVVATKSSIQPEVGRAPLDEFDPPAADRRDDSAAATHMESRLATLQQQIGQLAQTQVSQKAQAQAQAELQADELQQTKELINQLQKERDSSKIEKLIQEVKDLKSKSPAATNGKERPPDDVPGPGPEKEAPPDPKKPVRTVTGTRVSAGMAGGSGADEI